MQLSVAHVTAIPRNRRPQETEITKHVGVVVLAQRALAIEAPPGPPQGAMPSVVTSVMHS